MSIFLEPKPRDKTEVTLIQAGFSAAESRRRALEVSRERWEDCLAKLTLYLESGKTCKSDRLTFLDLKLLQRPAKRRKK